MRVLGALVLALTAVQGGAAQQPGLRLPPVAGVSLVQTLNTPEGDRESVHTVAEVTAGGLRWIWQLVEVGPSGDTVRQRFRYAELHADLADAIRFRAYHDAQASEEHPGYTMHALSRAVYRRLRATGSDTFQIMAVEAKSGGAFAALGLGARRPNPVRWRGTLSVVTPVPVPFPLLVNGRRVEVPSLHLRGQLTVRTETWQPELWVLADSAYPLLLKWVGAPTRSTNLLQTIRVDIPGGAELERGMASSCRAELSGIYFGFNSAVLDAASGHTIEAVAALLAKHPDWVVTLEGHTDSIGSAAANRALSERRVEAVRIRLAAQYKVNPARLRVVGHGAARPRESNSTIEGRARNRRVELVRDCAARNEGNPGSE